MQCSKGEGRKMLRGDLSTPPVLNPGGLAPAALE